MVTEFIGRFHPVLVHLPIGGFLLLVFFFFMAKQKGFENLHHAILPTWWVSFAAGLASAITGMVLSQSNGYNEQLVNWHQIFAITLLAFALFVIWIFKKRPRFLTSAIIVLAVLVIITGHLGGSLTHGANYLTAGFTKQSSADSIAPLQDVQQALVYNDIVKPIFSKYCYSCHGPAKQKGKLRLDNPMYILKGGEDGPALVAGNPAMGELIRRLKLQLNDEDHMPPASKPQLSAQQIELLQWWIATGASFEKRVNQLPQPPEIQQYLKRLETPSATSNPPIELLLPKKSVAKAPDSVLAQLWKLDVSVTPISSGTHFLAVNFSALDSLSAPHIKLIESIAPQILWLNCSALKFDNQSLRFLSTLINLTRLNLSHTRFNDATVQYLKNLPAIEYLNLMATPVSNAGFHDLVGLKTLKQLYIGQTKIDYSQIPAWQQKMPGTYLDTGGFVLPFLPTDTQFVKFPNP